MACYNQNKDFVEIRRVLGEENAIYFLNRNNNLPADRIYTDGKEKKSRLYERVEKAYGKEHAINERFRTMTSKFITWFGNWQEERLKGTYIETGEPKIFYVELNNNGSVKLNRDGSIDFTDTKEDGKLQIPVYVKVTGDDIAITDNKGEVIQGTVRFPFQIKYAVNAKEIKKSLENTVELNESVPKLKSKQVQLSIATFESEENFEAQPEINTLIQAKLSLIKQGKLDIGKELFSKIELPKIDVKNAKYSNKNLIC